MITVNPVTHVIFVPRADLSVVSGSLYQFDTDVFRKNLRTWEATEEGRTELRTHRHNTEYSIAGVVYSRSVEMLNGYQIEFESFSGAYSVKLVGSNNNMFDIQSGILVQNNVQVIPNNSAGLQVVTSGSGVTAQDKADISALVWQEAIRTLTSGAGYSGATAVEVYTEFTRAANAEAFKADLTVTTDAIEALNNLSTIDVTGAVDLSSLTALVDEIHIRLGLSVAKPLTNKSDGGLEAAGIDIVATSSGNDIIQTRQP